MLKDFTAFGRNTGKALFWEARRVWHRFRLILLPLLAAFCVVLLLWACPGANASAVTLRKGDRGENVYELQEQLALAGYLDGEADGVFGNATYAAVIRFQNDVGLTPDGIVGPNTWSSLAQKAQSASYSKYVVAKGDTMYAIAKKFGVTVEEIAAASGVLRPELINPGQELKIPICASAASRGTSGRANAELLHWDVAKTIFTARATIIDCATGLSFQVQRRGGHNHADAEPLTAADTAILKQIYDGKWSWSRRAVIVLVGDRRIAASINGMPHGGCLIKDNNFDGHFCVHFLGSRTHASALLDPDHQRMVNVAAGL